ncbi:cytochrome C2 [Advenella kashmirensis W13003]|uniref:Cytochrome C2 n=1 Tax=Advenella kashmirensis W13003 TaxID=1424334 RepID=V8QWN3_9BURK|nr:RidA family protein [Advenella kashmirensis]ETF03424.1 cytochrome C2 [Advenella kashmirensis W13003]
MSSIERFETNKRMSRVVKYNGCLYLSGLTADNPDEDVQGQTRSILGKIEKFLEAHGSSKDKLLTAQIWLKDIDRDFAGMNEVWDSWLPEGAAPTRATGESKLASPKLLVEIIVTAAV